MLCPRGRPKPLVNCSPQLISYSTCQVEGQRREANLIMVFLDALREYGLSINCCAIRGPKCVGHQVKNVTAATDTRALTLLRR